jgi:hypothetical protein
VSPRFNVDLTDQQNSEGDAVRVQAQASTPTTGATLSYSATGLPVGLTIDPATGLISGTVLTGW